MTEVRRNNLEWARDIARSYRWALRAVAPEKCAELDQMARERGQLWIAPIPISAEAMDKAMDEQLTPQQIEQLLGVPAATIRSWARADRHDPDDPSKPLLRQHQGVDGPLYVPREVLDVYVRSRRGERHLPRAAGQ